MQPVESINHFLICGMQSVAEWNAAVAVTVAVASVDDRREGRSLSSPRATGLRFPSFTGCSSRWVGTLENEIFTSVIC